MLCLLFLAGCTTAPSHSPGSTFLGPQQTVLPARIISNFFVIESKWDDGKTYRFLIDTGSTISWRLGPTSRSASA